MFSALKFVAAGIIVALFGGFLLAGVLTTQQPDEVVPAAVSASPTPEAAVISSPTLEVTNTPPETIVRTDILPGVALVTEEVEPGVLRILSDGVRDLSPAHFSLRTDVSRDGGVWGSGGDGLFRLGDARAYRTGDLVTPDGTVWAADRQRSGEPGASDRRWRAVIRSHDGEAWTVRKQTRWVSPSRGWPHVALDVAPDGTVWAAWAIPKQKMGETDVTVAWFSDDGWVSLEPPITSQNARLDLAISESGEVQVLTRRGGKWRLNRYVDGAWERVASVIGLEPTLGHDGTWWSKDLDTDPERWVMRRFDGTAWDEFELPTAGDDQHLKPFDPVLAPDGFAWASLKTYGGGYDDTVLPCGKAWIGDGIGRFDGQGWDRYLPGHCLEQIEFTPDGSAWVVANEGDDYSPDNPLDLYVIEPGAGAAGS